MSWSSTVTRSRPSRKSAADIQQICRVRKQDIRKFLDGIYVSEKGNVVEDAGGVHAPIPAVLARLPALLQNLKTRQFADPDLREDMDKLRELLDEYTKTKTTFDEYVGELNSGHLRWSPPHRNTVFWAENARKILEFENGALVRRLADIMQKPWDHDQAVLAIACNDVGCLVREVPEKRGQLERLGLKTRVMALMAEQDENVRWESLRALGGWLQYSFDSTK
ncbi:hypothetical protein CHGG_02797 [Chaetomium globosum CBS 148.51]|uniref:ATPase V1 complex subunit H C-terminal domain-containing protein n=1 Tax=Chaetomium globosum (strain ATCC 6205 / CBS 148.51 / DSM 1962 / NBRC 6347 / NRRL 1970) TaxID=306901 RepID=Q2HAF7_CHAGB|nr:uncharacterized protein CHGG_02797 [Chaetomium globosum CBS 148.51]EAQ90862.1 hypothetical protein CHGG_02797 [Chaetomium globosum CBS 148.51]